MSSYPIFIQLEPGQAGWRKVREREEPIKTYKDKGGPLGTAADRLAGTAVDCVISWKSLSLTFLALDIFVWCCHCLLNRLAPDMSESWQSSVLPISLNLDNLSCCLLFVWACFSPQHFNLLTSLSGTVFWYGLHLSCLNLDSVFLVESSLQIPTLFSSWHTLVSPCCFLHIWEIEIKTTAGVFPIRKYTGCCSDGRTDMWNYSVLPNSGRGPPEHTRAVKAPARSPPALLPDVTHRLTAEYTFAEIYPMDLIAVNIFRKTLEVHLQQPQAIRRQALTLRSRSHKAFSILLNQPLLCFPRSSSFVPASLHSHRCRSYVAARETPARRNWDH